MASMIKIDHDLVTVTASSAATTIPCRAKNTSCTAKEQKLHGSYFINQLNLEYP